MTASPWRWVRLPGGCGSVRMGARHGSACRTTCRPSPLCGWADRSSYGFRALLLAGRLHVGLRLVVRRLGVLLASLGFVALHRLAFFFRGLVVAIGLRLHGFGIGRARRRT